MLKKTVGTIIVASALVASVGAIESEASQWNNSSLTQNQAASGAWAKMTSFKSKSLHNPQTELSNGSSAQSGTVTGSQIQSGKSAGEATANQSDDRTIDVGESENTKVEGTGATNQEVAVKNPSYVFMGQRKTTAVFSFEASIEGGPSIQNQIVQDHTNQATVVIEK